MKLREIIIFILLFVSHIYSQTKTIRGYYIETHIVFNYKVNHYPFAYFIFDDSIYVASCYKFHIPARCAYGFKKHISYASADSLYRKLSSKLPPTYNMIETDTTKGVSVIYRVLEIEAELQFLPCTERADILFGCIKEKVVCPQNIICAEPTDQNLFMEKKVKECKDLILKNFNAEIYNRIGIE